ncbi:MAG: polyprenyl synthetase family protein [Oscillospiraceae bacterium]|nr:polyprenyl synthetase family protein [Oscillospiraceae bacterium]
MTAEFEKARSLIENRLNTLFTKDVPDENLASSMRYSLLAGGKRIRPVIVLEFAKAAGGDMESALDAACAAEMLHTYSLIHDDLPCMDDDDLRRGKPTNHVVYGECTAVLAGDALQAECFKILSNSNLPAERVVKMVQYLSNAAGLMGICGGQALDIAGEGKSLNAEEVSKIHSLKTASLLVACAKMGVAAAGGSDTQLRAAEEYAENLGIAFQIRDDVLDVISTTEELGKPVGSDDENEKSTFVTLFGVDKCRELIEEKTQAAIEAVKGAFENCEFLVWLAGYLAGRVN